MDRMAAAARVSTVSIRIYESAPGALTPAVRARCESTYEWLRRELIEKLTSKPATELRLVAS